MAGMESDTVGGFNSTLSKHKKNVEDTALVSLVLFSNSSEVVYDRVNIGAVDKLTADDYTPCGCTALLDAVGDAIRHIATVHKYARREDLPSKTVFVIITDGLENASRRYSYEDIKSLISRQKERYNWEFLFLGANIDSEKEAENLGISRELAVNYHCDPKGTAIAYESVSEFFRTIHSDAANTDANSWRKKADRDYNNRRK